MITVNLRPGLKRKRARIALCRVARRRCAGWAAGSRIPLLLVAVVSWVGVLGWLGFVLIGTTRELQRADAAARAEPRREQAVQGLPGREAPPGERSATRWSPRSPPSAPWTATATCGPTCSTKSPARCRPTPGWWTWVRPVPSRIRRRRAGRRPRPPPSRHQADRWPRPRRRRCSSRSTGARWTSRPTPGSSASSRPRPGSPT